MAMAQMQTALQAKVSAMSLEELQSKFQRLTQTIATFKDPKQQQDAKLVLALMRRRLVDIEIQKLIDIPAQLSNPFNKSRTIEKLVNVSPDTLYLDLFAELAKLDPTPADLNRISTEAQLKYSAKRTAPIRAASPPKRQMIEPAMRPSPQPRREEERTAIYFNNRVTNVAAALEFCPNLRIVAEPDRQPTFSNATQFLKSMSGNSYLESLSPADYEAVWREYAPNAGISPEAMSAALDDWLREHSAVSKKYAIFAWDGTLTKFPTGLPTFPDPSTSKAALAVLFGGQQRLDALRRIKDRLLAAGVELVIMTDDEECGTSLALFQMIMAFMQHVFQLICSNNRPHEALAQYKFCKRATPASAVPVTLAFDRAIFFDNDDRQLQHVRDFCKDIKLVKVNETRPLEETPFDQPPLANLVAQLPGNQYVKYIRDTIGWTGDTYDSRSGIMKSEIVTLYDWLAKTASDSRPKAALFDWDRTLSQFEGFPNLSVMPRDLSYYDVLVYLLGGKKRFNMIQDMFKYVQTNYPSVQIVIATNNGNCTRYQFKNLARMLIGREDIQFVCGKNFQGNKGYALQKNDNPLFSQELCSE